MDFYRLIIYYLNRKQTLFKHTYVQPDILIPIHFDLFPFNAVRRCYIIYKGREKERKREQTIKKRIHSYRNYIAPHLRQVESGRSWIFYALTRSLAMH